MRPITINLEALKSVLTSEARHDHVLDLETGKLLNLTEDDFEAEELHAIETQKDRYVPIEPLGIAERVAMREAFLFDLHDPHAHPVLSRALTDRKPLRTFDYELKNFPKAQKAWEAYEATQVSQYALIWLHDHDLEPVSEDYASQPDVKEGVPEGILRRMNKSNVQE
ncbi:MULTISPECIES: UPF0158 family protein [Pseudomonas]|uniref:Phage protein n=2 Tax=Pseudomonas TaxID=286 RepID=A0ABS0MTN6_PSELU|nr:MULTISPECIES: UPF0158 family protein [Pseudomonas]AYN95295.1 hypothetical protein EAW52_15655 [Pseudomonas sp. LTJR-52]MBH3440076.1 hypothetical protein [Pseudomonas luteola]MBW5414657.1 hypothetical protein [Pseudomonas sp. MAG002Y]SER03251.1 Uncharacterised protein family (UPF0158) [Pseudomonas lutea]